MSYLLAGTFCVYLFWLMRYTRGLVIFMREEYPDYLMVRHPDVWESMERPCLWFLNCRICVDLYILREWDSLKVPELRRKVNRFYAMSLPCIALGILWVVLAYRSIQTSDFIP